MAGISGLESRGGKRKVDHDLPLVPFIDFMVCLVAFLMVTAVWMNMGRLEATARAPGDGETPAHGQHRTASDRDLDRAVIHVKNDQPFEEVVAVLDALNVPRRPAAATAGGAREATAFTVAFAAR